MKSENGFTLLEMSIVLVVIAALLVLIIPNVGKVNSSTEKTTDKAAISAVESQILLYKMDNPTVPEGEQALLDDMKAKEYITQEQLEAYQSRNTEADES